MGADSLQNAVFLINPTRFPGFARKLKKILKVLSAPNLVECRCVEDFSRAVEEFASSDRRFLLIWGGDGTANLAINAYMRSSIKDPHAKALGFLRGGSGNGIQDSYEVPRSIAAQVESFMQGMEKEYLQPVDLISADGGDGEVFCQLLGIGLDARVLEHREGSGRGRPGMLNYIVSVLRCLVKDFTLMRTPRVLTMEEGKYAFKGTRTNAEFPFARFTRETRSPLIEMATRPYYAKMFKIAPDVVCNDGVFDIYSYNFHRRREILLNVGNIWNGWHSRINRHQARRGRPVIERYAVRRAVVEMKIPFAYHATGNSGSALDRNQTAVTG